MDTKPSSAKGWAITLIGALFFFYAFLECNMMTPLMVPISKYFGANSTDIGRLAAWFFYANIIFLIPAGLFLDRFPLRILMGLNMLIAIAGTVLFAFSESLEMASLARFITGIMMAFGLIICLKLASIWLMPNQMALASSLIITIGMLGGIASQAPIAKLVDIFGWKGASLVVAILGLVIGIILWFVVKDPKTRQKEITKAQHTSIWKSLGMIVRVKHNWLSGIYIGCLNLPVAILGALFGIPYLTQVYDLSVMMSASIISMIFIGMIIGSPVFGWFSDFIKRRKLPMLIGSVACLVLILFILYIENFSVVTLHLLFFFVGFTSAAQVLGYPLISESNPNQTVGTALSLAAFIVMGGGYGLGLPFVGKLLDLSSDSKIIDGIHHYSNVAYQKALMSIPIGIIIAIIMIFFMNETKCQSILKKD